jgi:hypothetical protein
MACANADGHLPDKSMIAMVPCDGSGDDLENKENVI